jgi:hypothetical protein
MRPAFALPPAPWEVRGYEQRRTNRSRQRRARRSLDGFLRALAHGVFAPLLTSLFGGSYSPDPVHVGHVAYPSPWMHSPSPLHMSSMQTMISPWPSHRWHTGGPSSYLAQSFPASEPGASANGGLGFSFGVVVLIVSGFLRRGCACRSAA